MNEQDLLNLKDQIEEAKTEANQLEGQRKGLIKQLEEDWQCKNIKQAKTKLKKMKKDIEDLDTKIKNGTAELEEKYEFD